MAFDGFVLNSVVVELNNCLIGGRVQKIYEPNNNEILLSIYSNGLQYALNLNISSNFYAAYLTTNKKENPISAPNFCMLLRKHLIGFKITNIFTMQLERILIIEFVGNDENHNPIAKKLMVELMGKYSNILLLNDENTIIDSLRHFSIQSGASRNIMPKAKYCFPISEKIDISKYNSLKLDYSSTLSNFFINNFIGVSKVLVAQALFTLQISNTLTNENFKILANYLINLRESVFKEQVKCMLINSKDYTIIPCLEKEPLQINNFLDDYYSQKQKNEQFVLYRNQLLNFISGKLKKVSKKLSIIDEKIKECNNMEEYKLYGELITSYLYQITEEHVSNITLINYYTNKPICIPLDISISPSENAKKYFKKYHKLKNTFTIVQEQKNNLEKEINYVESIVYEIQSAQNLKDLDEIYEEIQATFNFKQNHHSKNKELKKHKMQKNGVSQSPICYEIQGFKVLVGKNNRQNDLLTFKVANKEDLWFHVKNFHGSHVILCTNGAIPSQDVINECASIAAHYSKAVYSSNVPVDYTLVKYVKKPNKAKPGMVIFTNYKTVNVIPKLLNN